MADQNIAIQNPTDPTVGTPPAVVEQQVEQAAPVAADVSSEPDFSGWSLEELREFQVSGAVPERFAEDAEPAEEPAAVEEETVEAAADDDAAEIAEETDEPAADAAPAFAFTEDADEDTFRAEADKYLAQVEITPELETILNRYRDEADRNRQAIQQFETVGDFETVSRTVAAFRGLVEFRQNEFGEFAPDTAALREYLRTEYPREHRAVYEDFLAEPSPRYAGLTVLQEYLKDGFGVTDGTLEAVDYMLRHNRLPVPEFTPRGLDPKVAEAYWNSPRRAEIEQSLEIALGTLTNEYSSEDEKRLAKANLEALNAELRQAQLGFDAARRNQEERAAREQHARNQREMLALREFNTATAEVSSQLAKSVAKALTFVEGNAAEVVADGITSLVRGAVSPDPDEATYYRERLKQRGIVHDWSRGRAILDRLYDTDRKLVAQVQTQDINPKAIEATRKTKAAILQELANEQKAVIATIVKAVAKNATTTLEKKIADAPKFKAVRSKTGTAPASAPKRPAIPTAEELAGDPKKLEELRTRLAGGDPYRRAVATGDLGGFAG